jgi:hypothetical protein
MHTKGKAVLVLVVVILGAKLLLAQNANDEPGSSVVGLTTPIDKQALSNLSLESQYAVEKAQVPVLAPRRPEWSSQVSIKSTPGRVYALQLSTSTFSFILYGGGTPRSSQPPELARWKGLIKRGNNGYLSRSEGVWNVRWTENDVGYLLTYACEPTAAELCASPDAALEVVHDLVLVGGKGATH